MPRTKKVETTVEESKDVAVNEATFDNVKEDIALVDEKTEEKTAELNDTLEKEDDSLNNSFAKLANTIADAVEKKAAAKQQQPETTKKPWKLGFWGYLGLAVIVKGAVEITRAITDAKRPRR